MVRPDGQAGHDEHKAGPDDDGGDEETRDIEAQEVFFEGGPDGVEGHGLAFGACIGIKDDGGVDEDGDDGHLPEDQADKPLGALGVAGDIVLKGAGADAVEQGEVVGEQHLEQGGGEQDDRKGEQDLRLEQDPEVDADEIEGIRDPFAPGAVPK